VGIDPDTWRVIRTFTPAIGQVVARLLQNADELYERSQAGIASLPKRLPVCNYGC
jgi:phytoene synthase